MLKNSARKRAALAQSDLEAKRIAEQIDFVVSLPDGAARTFVYRSNLEFIAGPLRRRDASGDLRAQSRSGLINIVRQGHCKSVRRRAVAELRRAFEDNPAALCDAFEDIIDDATSYRPFNAAVLWEMRLGLAAMPQEAAGLVDQIEHIRLRIDSVHLSDAIEAGASFA